MSIIGMAFMWALAFAAFLIVSRWPMGKVSDQRAKYWSKFEDK